VPIIRPTVPNPKPSTGAQDKKCRVIGKGAAMMTNRILLGVILASLTVSGVALAQVVFTKAQVADRIRKVEDGVDEFRKWAENRADKGKDNAQAAKTSGQTRGRTATQAQKDNANEKKDELDDALGDLNRSTNQLRRKFDPTDKWMETRPQVEKVLDDGRKINQVVVRGKYGTQAERYWAVLRESINDLARCYNLTPLGV
jgi:chaperonin cofactor prefoldin